MESLSPPPFEDAGGRNKAPAANLESALTGLQSAGFDLARFVLLCGFLFTLV
jgi:hypothetical protein